MRYGYRCARRAFPGALGALLLLAAPAGAEEEEVTELTLGGYIQPGFTLARDSEFDQNDREGFEFNNARLTGSGERDAGKDLKASFRFNFDVNQGNFSVRDVYGSLSYDEGLVALDVGQMKVPFGLALLQSEAYLQLPRSPGSRQLSFGRDLGAQLRGKISFGSPALRWWAMVANGEGGFRQRRNLDDEFLVAARVELAPLENYRGHIGKSEADLVRGPLRLALGANIAYTPSLNNALGLGDVGAKEHRYGLDARLKFRGFSLKLEGLLGDRGINDGSQAFWRYAAYAQAGYVLPWRTRKIQWEPAFRFEQLDINRDSDGLEGTEYSIEETEVRSYEAGVNAYLAHNNVKLQLAYRRTDLLEGPVVDRDEGPLIDDRLQIFMQVGWF